MAKGQKTGGRKQGTPNRLTGEARETFRVVLERLAPEAESWIRAAARESPAKGAELLLRLSDFYLPKVQREAPEARPAMLSQGTCTHCYRGHTKEELMRIATGATDGPRLRQLETVGTP